MKYHYYFFKFQKLKSIRWCEGRDLESRRAVVVSRVKWFVSVSRNCTVVVLSAAAAYLAEERWGMAGALVLTGPVEAGIPRPR